MYIDSSSIDGVNWFVIYKNSGAYIYKHVVVT